MMLATAQVSMAQDMQKQPEMQKPQIESEMQAVEFTVSNSNVHIKNAANKVLEVYNLAGVKVSTIRIDSEDKNVELGNLPKGCYILKIDKTARKICIK